jgi:hypothetical protein
MYVCKYVCMYVCKYVCMYVYMYVSMYVCMYVCMYVYTYVRMCASTSLILISLSSPFGCPPQAEPSLALRSDRCT